MNHHRRFQTFIAEITRLNDAREHVILEAFSALEEQDPELAGLVLQNVGDRLRAARWMCMHQRAFGGRSAYETLADGEIDQVWDRVLGSEEPTNASAYSEARMAY